MSGFCRHRPPSPSWPWPSLRRGRVTRCRADLELGWDRGDKCLPNFKVVVIDCLNARLAQIFWTKRGALAVIWNRAGEVKQQFLVPVASVTIASGHQPHICSLRTPPSWITTNIQPATSAPHHGVWQVQERDNKLSLRWVYGSPFKCQATRLS